jgi:GNAT superfamily N-acetyltransferase
MSPLVIRLADLRDADRIAALSGELGYPTDVSAVAERVTRLRGSGRDCVLVAAADDSAIGWIHVAEQELLESDPRCEILGLVVDRIARRRGAGRALMAAAEEWARGRGLAVITVRSNVIRQESHPFYEHLGFLRTKTQHVYRKPLVGEQSA